MTAVADMLTREARARLLDRRRELDELAALMRQPGGLAGSPEPPPIHAMAAARDEAGEQ